jgi:phosphoglycerate dehydrogenase-like enzyme
MGPKDLSKEVILLLLPTDIPEGYQSRIKSKYPGIQIRWYNTLGPDGPAMKPEEIVPKELFEGVTILCARFLPSAELVPKCHYVQLTAAGPDKHTKHPLYQNPTTNFCSSSGVHPPQIAEWVIGTYIAHKHHFSKYAEYQQRGYWPSMHERATGHVESSPGLRMGILGYGAIGRQVARLAKTMGMEIYAFNARERSTPESKKDDSYRVPGTEGDPDGVLPAAWFHGTSKEAVDEFLVQGLDVLAMCLPLTDYNVNIIDEKEFGIMSDRKTFLINIGRGAHINTQSLITALQSGQIRGAALDVTDPEPLPQDHPLWKAPNLFITPHVSWHTPHYFARVMDILEHNLDRLSRGEKLMNLIDKQLNY